MRQVVLGAVILFAARAGADEYHYQNVALGERAMGMAGAYTALGAGPGSAWYNPAGLGFLSGTNFSVQTGVYGTVGDSTGVGGGFLGSDSGQFVSFPSTAVIVRQIGSSNHRIGLAVLTPDFDFRAVQIQARDVTFRRPNGDVTFGSTSLLQDDRDATLWTGPVYAARLHPRLALGAGLYFVYRNRDLVSKLLGSSDGQIQESLQVDAAMSHLSLVGMVGVRAEVVEGLFVGATFRTPNLRLAGSADVSFLTFDPASPRIPVTDLKVQYKIPWRAALGIAYARPKSFALAADVAVHGAVDPYPALEGETLTPLASEVAKKHVVNANVGVEVYLAGTVPIRAGFFTNFSAQATPRPEARDLAPLGIGGILGGQGEVPDLYGVSAGVGYESGGASIQLALNYVFGRGSTILGSAQADRSVRLLFVGIGGSYGF
jgi:long-chain fatty acid transport protein